MAQLLRLEPGKQVHRVVPPASPGPFAETRATETSRLTVDELITLWPSPSHRWIPPEVQEYVNFERPLPTPDRELSAKKVTALAYAGNLYFVRDKRLHYFVLKDPPSAIRVPTLIARCGSHNLWLYQDKVYRASDLDLTPHDVLALANEAANRRRLQLEKAHALQAMTQQLDSGARRQTIPQQVKLQVWQRDSGSCVECGSRQNLEFDHVIPLAMGGSNTARNLQLLCEVCNRRKGATLG